jgi:hypothetical protein
MGRRETRLVLGGVFALLVAFASNSAMGAIILADPFSGFAGGQGGSFQQFGGELSDLVAEGGQTAGMTRAAPGPFDPSDEENNLLTVRQLDGLSPAGGSAGAPSSASQGGGNAPSNAAMTGVFFHLPQPSLQTGLPGEARTAMPTGPPFELLRPPRLFGTVS